MEPQQPWQLEPQQLCLWNLLRNPPWQLDPQHPWQLEPQQLL
jgi:hypothetical protein